MTITSAPRYLPRAIINVNEAEESALVLAYVVHRVRETAQLKRRLRSLGALLALVAAIGAVGTAVLVSIQPADDQQWIWGASVLVVAGLGCVVFLVAAYRKVPRQVKHVSKAYWTMEVAPFDDGHILWDGFRSGQTHIEVFKAGGDLWSNVMGCLAHAPSVDAEVAVVQSLSHVADNLESIQPKNLAMPLVVPDDGILQVCRMVGSLLRPLSPSQSSRCTALLGSISAAEAAQLKTDWLEFWRLQSGEALHTNWAQLLARLKPWHLQFGVALGHIPSASRASPAPPELNDTRTRLGSSIPQIFDIVRKGFENEVAPQMQAEKAEYERQAMARETEAFEQRNLRQRMHNLEIQPLRSALANKENELAVLRQQIASYESQILAWSNQMGYEAYVNERERLTVVLAQNQASAEFVVGAAQVEPDKPTLAEMDDAISQMRTWRDRIGELRQTEAAVTEQTVQCRMDVTVLGAQFDAEDRAIAEKYAKDQQAARQAMANRVQVLRAPVVGVGGYESRVLHWMKDLTQPPEAGADQTPVNFKPDIERQVVEYRRKALESLIDRVRMAVTRLGTIDQQTRELTAACQKLGTEFAPWTSEIRLPVWLVRYADSEAWEPVLGPCVMMPLPAGSRTDMRCEFDEARFGLMRETLRGLPASWQLDQSLVATSVIANASSQVDLALAALTLRGLLSSELSVDIRNMLATHRINAGQSTAATIHTAPSDRQSDHV